MSAEERQAVEYFIQWMQPNGGGLADWINYYLTQGDEAKLRQIKEIYDKIKKVFGF
jgi:hypothetical protein